MENSKDQEKIAPGNCDHKSQSEPVVLVSSGTFECPLENDDTLLLSTLQGQVPHANGLYYFGSENNRRKAIKFDKASGKLYPPSHGWESRVYTISFVTQDVALLAEKDLAVCNLTKERDQLKRELDMRQQIEPEAERSTTLQKELDDANSAKLQLQESLDEIRQLYNDTKWKNGELEAAANWKDSELLRLEEFQKLYNDTKWRNGELEATLKWKDSELENASHRANETERTLEKVQHDLEDTRKRFNGLETTYELENRLLKESVKELEQKYEHATKLSAAVTELQGGSDKTEPFQMTAEYREYLCQMAEEKILREENQRLKHKCQGLEIEVRNVRERERQANETLASTRKDLDSVIWRCAELQAIAGGGASSDVSSTSEAKRRIDQLNSEVAHFQNLHEETQWKMQQLEIEMGEESRKLRETQKRCSELEFDMYKKIKTLKEAEQMIREMENTLRWEKRSDEMKQEEKSEHIIAPSNLSESKFSSNDVAATANYLLIGQMTEAKGQITLLESQLAHQRHLLNESNWRLGELQSSVETAHRYLWDAFVIRREPFINRDKWKLSMWYDGSKEEFRRVWYELDAPDAHEVYLSSSHYNWECLLMMMWHDHGKWGVWVDVPSGRHEFRFMVDGQWTTNDQYPTCSNGFGDEKNNWREIE